MKLQLPVATPIQILKLPAAEMKMDWGKFVCGPVLLMVIVPCILLF